MPKQNNFTGSIEITQNTFNKIMSWSLALDEIVYLAAIKNNQICDAYRLINTSRASRNYFDYCVKEERILKNKIAALGYESIILGHSHPSRNHVKHISVIDWKYLPKGSLQMISFPNEMTLGVWKLKTTYQKTLQCKFNVEPV